VHLLSSIKNDNRLELIEMEVSIPHEEGAPVVMTPWADIDSILAGPGFPLLREVVVYLDCLGWGPERDKLYADAPRGLPLLRERGVSVKLH
jgi:hypothetical protein